MMKMKITAAVASALLAAALAGCSGPAANAQGQAASTQNEQAGAAESQASQTADAQSASATTATAAAGNSILATADLFTSRDLEQTADTSGARAIALADNTVADIAEEGVYVVSGTASNATIRVEADSAAKVQIVLDGATITNETAPAIYVVSADKVFVTSVGENTLSATGTITDSDGEGVDAVIYAKDDLVLNGQGSLTVSSTGKGVNAKDDLKVTGGTYAINAADHALDANDSVCIADGSLRLDAGADGIHCANDEDGTLGYVYIGGGSLSINATDKGIEASSVAQVDGGTVEVTATEGIEGTCVQINDGTVGITATDDGINATPNSTSYSPAIEINGGQVSVQIAQGDTDALDSNGDLLINGGTVDITAQQPFDYDGEGALNGGQVFVNGTQVTELANATTKTM